MNETHGRRSAAKVQRRQVLQGLGALPMAAGLAALSAAVQVRAQKVATRARIMILGSGLGGIALANRLHAMLDGASITIVDAKEEHNYQPGYTLVATGVWPVTKVRDHNADFLPSGMVWVKEMAVAIDPVARSVTTTSGRKLTYDFLVVATGLHLDYAQIEGMDINAIGSNGLTSVYHSPQAAEATWHAMQVFADKGGQAVMTMAGTPLKCAGAPLKMTFMLADRLRQANTLAASNIRFKSATKAVFSVPAVNDNVLQRWQMLGIGVDYERKLTGIDIGARRARFALPTGGEEVADYDFIHVVPPMRAPDVVKNSDLAVKEGPLAAGGWLDVDKETLQHKRYPHVFGVGDINGTPRGKTAATIKNSAPIVANHLVQAIRNQPLNEKFDGYTSCPLIVREGSAMLIEFDYEGRLTPSLPGVEPLQESFMAWMMEYRMLKPAYMSVLKGRV